MKKGKLLSLAPIEAAILFLPAFEAKKDSSKKRETNADQRLLAHAPPWVDKS